MAVSTKSKLEVQIGEEIYYLNKVPDESSAVVKAETEKLLGAINLKTFVDDLGHVGSLIRTMVSELLDQNLLISRLKSSI